jgi:hypothetical protein
MTEASQAVAKLRDTKHRRQMKGRCICALSQPFSTIHRAHMAGVKTVLRGLRTLG